MSALYLVIFACFQLLFAGISAASLSDIESAQKACFKSTNASDVMEGRLSPHTTEGKKVIIDYTICILRRLNAINSDNSLNAEIVTSALSGMREIETSKINKGLPSDQQVRISDAMRTSMSNAIRNCITEKGNTAEDSVKELLECLS